MGAELSIRSRSNPARERFQPWFRAAVDLRDRLDRSGHRNLVLRLSNREGRFHLQRFRSRFLEELSAEDHRAAVDLLDRLEELFESDETRNQQELRPNEWTGVPTLQYLDRVLAQELVHYFYDAMYPEDGHFRDSYNGTCVLWTLGLSWWNDVIPLLDENNLLQGENLKTFRGQVAEVEQELPTEAELRQAGLRVEEPRHSVEAWHTRFRDRRGQLLRFLDRALDLDEGIHCSL